MALIPGAIIDPWYDVPERGKVRIMAPDIGGVTGLVPEQFAMDYGNTYEQPFAQILSSFNTGVVAAQQLLNKGGKVDFTATLQELKRAVWSGASQLRFNLNLFYLARRGATIDVVNPIKRLLKLSAAGTAIRGETEFAERQVSATVVKPPPLVHIEIGYILRCKKAAITNVTVTLPTNVTDFNGQPNEAMVTLQIVTNKMFLADDTEVEFMGGQLNRWGAPL